MTVDLTNVDSVRELKQQQRTALTVIPPARATREARGQAWPAPARPEAFHGALGDFVRLVAPQTEADPHALLVCALLGIGNQFGRDAHLSIGSKQHFANEFALLVGSTATGHKGTAISDAEYLLQQVDPHWHMSCWSSGLRSGEGMIENVRDPSYKPAENPDDEPEIDDPGATDKRRLFVEEEFSKTLEVARAKNNNLGDELCNAWDGAVLRSNARRQNKLAATGHTISVLGAVTPELLRDQAEGMGRINIYNGFANRFLFVASRASKTLPLGGNFDSLDWMPVVAELRGAREWVAENRPARVLAADGLTPAASDLWTPMARDLIEQRENDGDGPINAATGRARPHILRMAWTFALVDCESRIDVEHLQAAKALWDYCAASVEWALTGVVTEKPDRLAERLRGILAHADPVAGISRSKIRERLGTTYTEDRIVALRDQLVADGVIEVRLDEKQPGKPGPRTERWFIRPDSEYIRLGSVTFAVPDLGARTRRPDVEATALADLEALGAEYGGHQ